MSDRCTDKTCPITHLHHADASPDLPPEQPWLDRVLARVDQLAELKHGWNEPGSVGTTHAAVHVAKALVTAIAALRTVDPAHAPQLVPADDGGVTFAWRENGFELDLDVNADGRIEGWLHRPADDATMEWS
jgi:hypothetical protein